MPPIKTVPTNREPATMVHDDPRSFDKIILERRQELDLAQASLAKRMGVGQQTVSRWETGHAVPRPRTVRELAFTLGLDAGLLLVKAGYLTDREVPASNPISTSTLDRIQAKYSQLDDQGRATVENLIDVMLRKDGE